MQDSGCSESAESLTSCAGSRCTCVLACALASKPIPTGTDRRSDRRRGGLAGGARGGRGCACGRGCGAIVSAVSWRDGPRTIVLKLNSLS